MATQNGEIVGKAVIVYGTVKAVSAAGVERLLTPNSPVYADERIVTGADGSISILLTEQNAHLDLGRMSEMVLDEDVYAAGQGRYEVADTAAEVADIQAALEGGNFDPTTGLPATAAGAGVVAAGPRGGGRHLVIFTPDQLEVIPDSGAETIGISRNFLDPPPVEYMPEDEPITGILGPIAAEPAPLDFSPGGPAEPPVPPVEPPINPPPPADTAPGIGQVEFTLYEAHLADGTSPNSAALVMHGTLADLKVDFGPDTPGSLDFGHGNVILIDGVGGDSLTIAGIYGTLVVNDDGTWHYTLTGNTLDHTVINATGVNDQVQESFPFSAIDSDGSVVPGGMITAHILDDGPSIAGTDVEGRGMVHEDALSNYDAINGNPANNPDQDRSTGNHDDVARDTDTTIIDLTSLYTITPGADGLASQVYEIVGLSVDTGVDSGLTSKGETVYYFQDGNSIVARAGSGAGLRDIFTLTVDSATGQAIFNLNDQLDHNPPPEGTLADDDDTLDINNLGQYLQVKVTDKDGDSASLNLADRLTITVEDDIPKFALPEEGLSLLVHEDALPTGNLEPGANPAQVATAVFQLGDILSQPGVVLTGADEPVSFNYKVVIPDTLPNDLTSQGEDVWFWVNQNGVLEAKAGDRVVFTLEVDKHSGEATFTLLDQLDHPAPPEGILANDYDLLSLDLGQFVQAGVVDYDGDTVYTTMDGLITVQIEDDIPRLALPETGPAQTVYEDGLAPGNTDPANVTTTIFELGDILAQTDVVLPGADEPVSFNYKAVIPDTPPDGLTSQGENVWFWVNQNGVLEAKSGDNIVFTLEVGEKSGTATFTLKAPLDHPQSEDVQPLDLGQFVQVGVVDNDGDTVYSTMDGLVTVQVQDASPQGGVGIFGFGTRGFSADDGGLPAAGRSSVVDTDAEDAAAGPVPGTEPGTAPGGTNSPQGEVASASNQAVTPETGSSAETASVSGASASQTGAAALAEDLQSGGEQDLFADSAAGGAAPPDASAADISASDNPTDMGTLVQEPGENNVG